MGRNKVAKSDSYSLVKNIDYLKAYALGVIYGDGHVSKRVVIALGEKDIVVLKVIAKILENNYPIKTKLRKNDKNPISILDITGEKFAFDIAKAFSLKSNKSECLIFPTKTPVVISSKLLPSFISGYLSADGCITWNKKSRSFHLRFDSACDEFLKDIEMYIITTLNLPKRNHLYNKGKNKLSNKERKVLIFCGKEAVKICEFIIKNTTTETRLQRKFDVYKQYINRPNKRLLRNES